MLFDLSLCLFSLAALLSSCCVCLLGWYELEADDEELGVGFAVLEDVSEGVCAALVRRGKFTRGW